MPPDRGRYYADSQEKLAAAVVWFNDQAPDLVVCLGDLIDSPADDTTDLERCFLSEALTELSHLNCPRRFVLGNHDVWRLTKREFLERVGQDGVPYGSLDQRGIHCVFLDACYRSDGVEYAPGAFEWFDSEIPEQECAWLATDLAATANPTVVFVHQRLDRPRDDHYAVSSAAAIREVLKSAGKVLLVVQGHSHENERAVIDGIPYLTLRAMVLGQGRENSAAALLTIGREGVSVLGFGQQANWPS